MTMSWTGDERETRRLTKQEIEQRILGTATSLVSDNGLTVSLNHLRLDELLERAGVPKTSFYRVWESKDAFLITLLGELVQPNGGMGAAFDQGTLDIVRETIQQHSDLLDDEVGRGRLLREVIRRGAERNFEATRTAKSWQTYMAVMATLPGIVDKTSKGQILAVLRKAENDFIDAMASFYDEMLPYFRRQFKAGRNSHHLAAAGAAVVEGLIQRYVVNPDLVTTPVPGPALDGGTTDWHLAAIGFLGVMEEMLEPVVPPAG